MKHPTRVQYSGHDFFFAQSPFFLLRMIETNLARLPEHFEFLTLNSPQSDKSNILAHCKNDEKSDSYWTSD
jgi:hypothetical protein